MEIGALVSTSTIIARLILGSVMLWAGISKARQVDAFESVIRDFGLTNRGLSRVIGRLIPLFECSVGLLILLGFNSFWAATGAVMLLGTFTILVLRNVLNGRRLTCLCFGRNRDAIGWWTIHRNVGLILLAGFVAVSHTSPIRIDTLFDHDSVTKLTVDQVLAAFVFSSGAVVIWLLIGEAMKYRGQRG